MVINGIVARQVEHAAQEWIKWRREYLTELAGGGTILFVILFLGLGVCVIKFRPINLWKMAEENNAG